VEFVFAPEERDVYSYECTRKELAPLGAKPSAECLARQAKAIALLRSFGVNKGPLGYKHLAPMGRSDSTYQQQLLFVFATANSSFGP
jgi:hypothetical protein